MPVDVGTNPGQFIPTIDHVNNGEYGNQVVLRRPSVDLENRTDALKTFAESEETRLDAVSAKADQNEADITVLQADTTPADFAAHDVDNTRHTVYASAAEVRTGTETQKVIAPDTYKTITKEWVGRMYDAIVGDPALAGVTHSKLADAIAAASAGWKILVTRSESINATVTIALDNIEIEFRRGASFSLGSATTALIITGDDCYINKGRFVGFTTAAINIGAAASRTMLRDTRSNGNTTDVLDSGTATSRLGEIIE